MTTLKRWEPKPGTRTEAVHNALIDWLIRVVIAQETRRREREATKVPTNTSPQANRPTTSTTLTPAGDQLATGQKRHDTQNPVARGTFKKEKR